MAVHDFRGWLRLHKFQIFFLHAARGQRTLLDQDRLTQVAPDFKTILGAAAAKDERRLHKFLKGCISQGRLNRSLSLY